MKNPELFTEEELAAKKECRINPVNILEELMPLLNDYFVGRFLFDGHMITYFLFNGQQINISVQ